MRHVDGFVIERGFNGGVVLWGLLIAVLVMLVIWLIVSLVGRRKGDSAESTASPQPSSSSALSILEERYAKGDIDRDDYLQRKSDLGG